MTRVSDRTTADPTGEADALSGGQSPLGRERADGAAPPDILATLMSLLRTGATADGVAVRVVQVELADDRVQRLELPNVVAAGAATRTRMYRMVEKAVDGMSVGDVLSYDELAARANNGSNSGPFRKCVKQYAAETGRLESTQQGFEKVK